MAINLSNPLNDKVISNQEKSFMRNLQANILKGHGREHVALVFLSIDNVDKARKYLHDYPVSDAHTQLEETKRFKNEGIPGGLIRLVFISKLGLDKFGHGGKFNGFDAFSNGMSADTSVLDNGTTASWQNELKQNDPKKEINVLLLIAYHDPIVVARIVGKLADNIKGCFNIVFIQEGKAYKNADGEGIEHFGYVDGRSQALMLTSQIEAEKNSLGGTDQYDPSAPLNQFILANPLDANGFGSFFVFRKLEEDVAGFKLKEEELAEKLKLVNKDAERAGAMVVGRFEDGTPVTLHNQEAGVPVVNNFNYNSDAAGLRCPFQAHIRKSNPRGSIPKDLEFDKSVQMARRGITYGTRIQDPDSKELLDKPNDGVGLLFMSYQASIEKQFQFMQTKWVNNEEFPKAGVGLDPVIGQGNNASFPQKWFPTFDSNVGDKDFLFQSFVKLKGGEYFYTPSLSGIKNL